MVETDACNPNPTFYADGKSLSNEIPSKNQLTATSRLTQKKKSREIAEKQKKNGARIFSLSRIKPADEAVGLLLSL